MKKSKRTEVKSNTRVATSPSKNAKSRNEKEGLSEIDELFSSKKRRVDTQKVVASKKKRVSTNSGTSVVESKGAVRCRGSTDWVDDGLGGIYNSDGYTGRVQEGIKIFKAHVLNKPSSGTTAKCPFDCDCCFI